ncbi:MAG: glutamate synthase-related protein [Anaerolineae bacterium]|nr:glutamate synthase-related protein [Anaerolineae bacterium]
MKLAHVGADAIILNGRDGLQEGHPTDIARYLPEVHEALAAISRRERVSLVVRGGIAAAEDVVEAIMLGADAVIVDWPLLIALECRLQEGCVEGAHVCGVDAVDADWATQRLVNLLAAWMDHLRQALGALGVDDVERLRGARGRAAAEAAARAGAPGGLRHVTDPSVSLAHVLGR